MDNMLIKLAKILHSSTHPNANFRLERPECKQRVIEVQQLLATLRHPDVKMVEAGCDVHDNAYGVGVRREIVAYRAMIDSILMCPIEDQDDLPRD